MTTHEEMRPEPEEDPQAKQREQKRLLALYENAGRDNEDEELYGGAQGDEGDREECPSCGRKFASEALDRHIKICKKVFVQKRKVFDTKKVRQEAIMQDVMEHGGISSDDYKPQGRTG